jgi:hypothetical protein
MRTTFAALIIAGLLMVPAIARAQADRCGQLKSGEQCGEGNGRQTEGGSGTGKDVLWGDWELAGNGTGQSDVLRGGAGNDFLYPSHGHNLLLGGPGNDRIIAYYGHGLIDCGPGTGDYAQTRWQSGAYKVRNCERVRHFCAFGSKPNGDCKKPGESAFAVLSRQASQSALLARLDAW